MSGLYSLIGPFMRMLPPETAHELTLWTLKSGIAATFFAQKAEDPESLNIGAFGLKFPNPVGMAAGFDKNALVPLQILQLGFGFTEAGTVTPRPQIGNPRPRIFRLSEDQGIINRLGFNNEGLEVFLPRMMQLLGFGGIVGANLGANKDSEDRVQDYVAGLRSLLGYADYFTINVSSPNTPGLRGLQSKDELTELIERLIEIRAEVEEDGPKTPLLLKIAPDVTDDELVDITDVVVANHIDGLIIGNTTIAERENLTSKNAGETGGLSGRPLFDLSTRRLRQAHRLTKGKIALVGVGGIASGREAYEKILSGASLVQLYSAMTYQGPGLVKRIKKDMVACMESDGYKSITEAVGAGNH